MNLDLKEGFEILDISIVRSEKLGNTIADPNAFFHPAFTYLSPIIAWGFQVFGRRMPHHKLQINMEDA